MALNLNYLASHSRNLESLLQSYRQMDLTIHSVFLVLAVFLLARILEAATFGIAIALEVALVSLAILSIIVMHRFRKVINARGEDVNWWYKEMVRAEQIFPEEERAFTRFKIHQSGPGEAVYESIMKSGNQLSEMDIQLLLDTDLQHVRHTINSSIYRVINGMWVILLLLSVGGIIYRLLFSF
jgi:hypothetical protein